MLLQAIPPSIFPAIRALDLAPSMPAHSTRRQRSQSRRRDSARIWARRLLSHLLSPREHRWSHRAQRTLVWAWTRPSRSCARNDPRRSLGGSCPRKDSSHRPMPPQRQDSSHRPTSLRHRDSSHQPTLSQHPDSSHRPTSSQRPDSSRRQRSSQRPDSSRRQRSSPPPVSSLPRSRDSVASSNRILVGASSNPDLMAHKGLVPSDRRKLEQQTQGLVHLMGSRRLHLVGPHPTASRLPTGSLKGHNPTANSPMGRCSPPTTTT